MVYLMDEEDFALYQNGNQFRSYYSSGKIEYDTFEITLNLGEYYIVLSNTYAIFSTKNIQLQVSRFCN